MNFKSTSRQQTNLCLSDVMYMCTSCCCRAGVSLSDCRGEWDRGPQFPGERSVLGVLSLLSPEHFALCLFFSINQSNWKLCKLFFFGHNLQTGGSIKSEVEKSAEKIRQLIKLAEDLVPKMVDVKEKEIGDLLENEMHSTSSAIELAAKKIEVSWW